MRKIGISSEGQDLDSQVDLYFGRSLYVCIVEWDNGQINNYNVLQSPMTTQTLANEGIEALVTGHVGPGAFNNLQQEGIDVYQATAAGKVEDAAKDYFGGNLTQLTAPNLGGGGRGGRGPGMGRGKGGGRGQGSGRGRGGRRGQP